MKTILLVIKQMAIVSPTDSRLRGTQDQTELCERR